MAANEGLESLSAISAVSSFPFLRLPVELRLNIYRYHLSRREPIILLDDEDGEEYGRPILGVNLLLTCSQVHDEAVDILYGHNRFELWPHFARTTDIFLKCLVLATAKRLQHVELVLNLRRFEHIDYVVMTYEHKPLAPLKTFVIAVAVTMRAEGEEEDEDEEPEYKELPEMLYSNEGLGPAVWNGCEWLGRQLFGVEDADETWWMEDEISCSWDACGNQDVTQQLDYMFPEGYVSAESMYGKRKQAERQQVN